MIERSMEIRPIELYQVLGDLIGSAPDGKITTFDLLEQLEGDHGECTPEHCEQRLVLNYIGCFAMNLLTLLQAYTHAVMVLHAESKECSEHAHLAFSAVEEGMECITGATSKVLRAYAELYAKDERKRQFEG